MIGKKLAHYQIESLLGAGGMGEVYRARDMRLERVVAVKVLPPHLSDQPELRERFEREARTISSLNHPHICTLFDVGRQDGTDFLVMEFLQGQTLGERLKKGPLPVDEAMKYAIQIADALDKAHRLGVVHRDLKPANIMLTSMGAKLLDFGLAKLTAPAGYESRSIGASAEKTIGTNLTARGSIVGTLQYMSPEQLAGEDADARADIFAFGAVLFEMFTGRTAFQGKSQVTLISSIVSAEPPPASTLRPEMPALLDHIIKRCLAKEPDERWQTASDLMRELQWIVKESPAMPQVTATVPSSRKGRMWMGAAAVLGVLLITPAVLYFKTPIAESIPMRLSVIAPDEMIFAAGSGGAPWPELSPDGRRIVFGSISKDGKDRLFLRSLDSDTPQPLNGTEGGQQPFWSPDGRHIAFFAQNKLKRVDTAGGAPQTICSLEGAWREGAWGADDTIIFAMTNHPLQRVGALGGQPQPLSELDKARSEASHLYPQLLPDGRHFLFLAQASDLSHGSISVGSLDSKEVKHLVDINSKARYASPGFLLYVREASLVAQPFDAKRLELTGEASPIVDNIRHTSSSGIAAFSVSKNGTLAYRTGDTTENTQVTWFDRTGKELGRIGEPAFYLNPELSPDGKHAVLEKITETGRDLWLLELARGIFTRFTSDANAALPIWSPDGNQIFFASTGNFSLKPVNGAGKEEQVLKRTGDFLANDWTRDGKTIVFERGNIQDLWTMPLSGDRKPSVLMETRFTESEAQVSPNGRWIAYTSNESGRFEVYAQSFPSNENRIQISTEGGSKPRWRDDGSEIFYMAANDKLMAVSVTGEKKLEVSRPEPLFQVETILGGTTRRSFRQQYDVTADGKRFLFLASVQNKTPPPVTLFSNWQAMVKR